ncbi:sensor histidine kinase [Pseudogemmobacter sonorensis]|uniref:sensor histidine kinase n=1 Tax=Pseudogemmobacter sonorensis TaxID=2989681 RepID=UPI0036CEEED3
MAETPPWQSVRTRLLVIALLPTLLLMPLLMGVTMQRWTWRTDQILAARVGSDLTVAQQYLSHLVDNTAQGIDGLARSARLRDALAEGPGQVGPALSASGLDFLILTDEGGRVLAAHPAPPNAGAASPLPPESPLILAARAGEVAAGIEILSPEALTALSPALAERARVALRSDPEEAESRGMVILAAAPVALPRGQGVLAGGILLNRNDDFVDRINDLVYPATNPGITGDTGGFDHGVTTLFLGDTRIATTLRPSGRERALGTRASAEVRARVLGTGEAWRNTAFVVDDWYVSAYDAIIDSRGARVGMLYTGFPRAPYSAARRVTWAIAGLAFLAIGALSVPLFLHWARGIFRPVEAMGITIGLVEAGDMDARSGAPPGADELIHLARHLDRLLDLLQQRDRELRGLNRDLNARVEVRTAELRHANLALEAATRQLVLSEKLATIGEVTTGIAHEINNPLAVIQGNLEVLRMVMAARPNDGLDDCATEFALIEDQIRRIGVLVSQLLQFARPEEFAADGAPTDPAEVCRGLRPLIRHLLEPGGIVLASDLRSTRPVGMSPHEMQQVLVNLAVNAIQAMPEGGELHLTCEDAPAPDGREGVRITLRDTGTGMDEATLARIFDPFFTTRRTLGSGLGLSICQTLVNRQNGELRATSRPGAGASFTVWLPQAGMERMQNKPWESGPA